MGTIRIALLSFALVGSALAQGTRPVPNLTPGTPGPIPKQDRNQAPFYHERDIRPGNNPINNIAKKQDTGSQEYILYKIKTPSHNHKPDHN